MEFVRGGRVTTNYSLLRRGHYLIKSWFDFLREKSVSVSVPEADGSRNSFTAPLTNGDEQEGDEPAKHPN